MNKKIYIQLAIIFLTALMLRILYFNIALSELSINELLRSLPDTGIYWTVARHLLEFNPNGEYWLFQVGPGYGGLLAGLLAISGHNLYFVYSVHIVIGSLIPVVIYLISFQLLDNKIVSLIAGLFAAVSFTSVTLSANLVSDVPFVFCMSLGILFFIIGMKKSEMKWFVLAGVLSGVALFIRSIALFYPIIFFIIPVFYCLLSKIRMERRIILNGAITAGIMIVLVLSWSARNYNKNDAFTFGANGMKTARLRLAALAVVNNTDGLLYRDVILNWSQEDSVLFNHRLPSYAEEYNRDAQHFISVVREHPLWLMKQFLTNINENATNGNFIPILQIKSAEKFWNRWTDFNKYGFGHFLILLTLTGLFFLYRQKNYLAFVILGLTYGYFTFFIGFTMWQGARLHFPAEISFAILSAVTVSEVYKTIQNRLFTKAF